MPQLSNVLAVILGGGRGSRLYPLTKTRSKPAVPIAGKYRLIDIPLSNCINSGIFRMHVLTQFNSVSLHRHIAESYKFDVFHTGWVHVLAAEQTPTSEGWYQGTADAIRKQLFQIQVVGSEHVLILAGDHLYRMDYAPMVAYHLEHDADITVAVQPVARDEADRFGLLKRAPGGKVLDFVEKPKTPEAQAHMVSREDPARPYLGSMGIYLFKTDVLVDLLTRHPDFDDFGHHVIPYSIDRMKVYGFDFDGYWQDIGTIRSFYDVNLELTRPGAPFNLFDGKNPIYTHSRFLPCSSVSDTRLTDVLLSEGCVIAKADLSHSIIGLRSLIGPGTSVKDSIIMGADYYQERARPVPMGIGPDCHIEGAILDKNVCVGAGVTIKPFPRGTERDEGTYVVQDGIVVIPKNTVLRDGTVIAPEG
jgi:glucose-1-phosphate adenylyltransferase